MKKLVSYLSISNFSAVVPPTVRGQSHSSDDSDTAAPAATVPGPSASAAARVAKKGEFQRDDHRGGIPPPPPLPPESPRPFQRAQSSGSHITNGGPHVAEKDHSDARGGNLPSSMEAAVHRPSSGQVPGTRSSRQLMVDSGLLKDVSRRWAPSSRTVPGQQPRFASEVDSPASKAPLRPLNEANAESTILRASQESKTPATSTKPRRYVLFVVLAVLGLGTGLLLGLLLSALLRPGPLGQSKGIQAPIHGGSAAQSRLNDSASAAVRHEV
ncbi:uncharacterized protein LOC144153116 [Haemaphysalis longicornis]